MGALLEATLRGRPRAAQRIQNHQRHAIAISAQQPAHGRWRKLRSCHAADKRILRCDDLHVLNERDHPVAHYHAYHAGRRASVSVDRTVLAGALEPRALAFVRDWAKLHSADLLANWERARRNEPLLAVPPLPSMVTMSEEYLPVVAGVAVVADHVLRLLFSDGTAGDVDFSAERWTGVLEPLNDPAYFAQVILDPEAGTIAWPNGIDLAPEPLYEQARAHPLIAA